MIPIEIVRRFKYHSPSKEKAQKHELIRDKACDLAELFNGQCPENREKSIAIRKVEEAAMWANASIARGEEVDDGDHQG